MTIKKSLGKLIVCGAFALAAVLCLVGGISYAIGMDTFGSFWFFVSGFCGEFTTICFVAAALGYVLIYLVSPDNKIELIGAAALAALAILNIVTNNATGIFWGILRGLCATAFIAVLALKAHSENKMIMLILLGCAALYLILGDWLVGLVFGRWLNVYILAQIVRAILGAASLAAPAVFIFTSDTYAAINEAAIAEENGSASEEALPVSDDIDE